jgi:hypothetical protein
VLGFFHSGGLTMDMKDPEFVCGDDGIFAIVDGVKVAKRERGTWISLEPGWVVITRTSS